MRTIYLSVFTELNVCSANVHCLLAYLYKYSVIDMFWVAAHDDQEHGDVIPKYMQVKSMQPAWSRAINTVWTVVISQEVSSVILKEK